MTEVAVGQAAVDLLLEVLDLKPAGGMTFRGTSPLDGPLRVYGGQVAGQALVAAGRTVDPERHVHSLHGYFVRPGDPVEPIEYRVENIRDGRSFSVRRSVGYQHDKPIFLMSASFHRQEGGLDHTRPPGRRRRRRTSRRCRAASRRPDRIGFWAHATTDRRAVVGRARLGAPGDRAGRPQPAVWMRIDCRCRTTR